MTRAGYWQGLHGTIHITIHGPQYDYIMIHCDIMHMAMYCDISHSSMKMLKQSEIQVAVYDLGILNTSHDIIIIIQWTN